MPRFWKEKTFEFLRRAVSRKYLKMWFWPVQKYRLKKKTTRMKLEKTCIWISANANVGEVRWKLSALAISLNYHSPPLPLFHLMPMSEQNPHTQKWTMKLKPVLKAEVIFIVKSQSYVANLMSRCLLFLLCHFVVVFVLHRLLEEAAGICNIVAALCLCLLFAAFLCIFCLCLADLVGRGCRLGCCYLGRPSARWNLGQGAPSRWGR